MNGKTKLWVALMLLGVSSLCGTVISHEVRMRGIEGNRFTNLDANLLERRLKKELPPEWLREDLLEIKNSLEKLDDRLREIEKKVQ